MKYILIPFLMLCSKVIAQDYVDTTSERTMIGIVITGSMYGKISDELADVTIGGTVKSDKTTFSLAFGKLFTVYQYNGHFAVNTYGPSFSINEDVYSFKDRLFLSVGIPIHYYLRDYKLRYYDGKGIIHTNSAKVRYLFVGVNSTISYQISKRIPFLISFSYGTILRSFKELYNDGGKWNGYVGNDFCGQYTIGLHYIFYDKRIK